jgi:UPF0042 nucleotide-binding protein
MRITITSFGYKHDVPPEADLVLDARVLPNPYREIKLRQLSGRDAAVAMWLLKKSATQAFIEQAYQMLLEGVRDANNRQDSLYAVAVGCTGGHHRSVSAVEQLGGNATLDDCMYRHSITVHHRDLDANEKVSMPRLRNI